MKEERSKVSIERGKRFTKFLEYEYNRSLKRDYKIAEELGLASSAIVRLKKGENAPSKQTLILLKLIYGLNEEWFLHGINPMIKPVEQKDQETIENLNRRIIQLEKTLLKKEEKIQTLKRKIRQFTLSLQDNPRLTLLQYASFKENIEKGLTIENLFEIVNTLRINDLYEKTTITEQDVQTWLGEDVNRRLSEEFHLALKPYLLEVINREENLPQELLARQA